QAEDGIRDFHVTGVQTCALPISRSHGPSLDRTTQKGRENEAALDNIADSTWDVIAAMQKNGADQKQLQGVMQTSRDRFIAVAREIGRASCRERWREEGGGVDDRE